MKPDTTKNASVGITVSSFEAAFDGGELPQASSGRRRSSRSRSTGVQETSVNFEDLSVEFDRLPMTSPSGHPHPVELPSPINPEGGRKQSVETHRNLFCGHYDSCLDEAVKHGWNSFTCVRCSLYQVTPAEDQHGVDRFATKRKAS